MSVKRYTEQKEFAFGYLPRSREFIVNAPVGSVSVEVWDGLEWLIVDTITGIDTKDLRTAGVKMRITPAGGASYSLDENDGGL